MPINLVGRIHRTIVVEGLPSVYFEDCTKLLQKKCGTVEAWDPVTTSADNVDRLFIVFASADAVTAALAFQGMTFGTPDSKLVLWRADDKTALGGKPRLGGFHTLAPVHAAVAKNIPSATSSLRSKPSSSGLMIGGIPAVSGGAIVAALAGRGPLAITGPAGSSGGGPTAVDAEEAEEQRRIVEARELLQSLARGISGEGGDSADNGGAPASSMKTSSRIAGMNQADYVAFLDEHTERQVAALITLTERWNGILEKEIEAMTQQETRQKIGGKSIRS